MLLQPMESPLFDLAEGPVWNEALQRFYWTDINGKTLWYAPGDDLSTAQHVAQFDFKIGGFAFHQDGRMILCTDAGVYSFCLETQALERIVELPLADDERCNDIIVDPRGRLLIGTLKATLRDGSLLQVDLDGKVTTRLGGIQVSNGMCFSDDEQTLFHTDSFARTITVYDYDLEDGTLSNARLFYQGEEADGYPDGICRDQKGLIWVACWGAAQVIALNPAGEIAQRISVPVPQPSSLCFGGANYQTLLVTTANEGASDSETLGGFIYTMTDETFCGLPDYPVALLTQ